MSLKESRRLQAQVKFFDRSKGFGFIKRPNVKQDIFFHQNEMNKSKIDHLNENDIVEFDLIPVDGKGGKAVNIKFIAKAPR